MAQAVRAWWLQDETAMLRWPSRKAELTVVPDTDIASTPALERQLEARIQQALLRLQNPDSAVQVSAQNSIFSDLNNMIKIGKIKHVTNILNDIGERFRSSSDPSMHVFTTYALYNNAVLIYRYAKPTAASLDNYKKWLSKNPDISGFNSDAPLFFMQSRYAKQCIRLLVNVNDRIDNRHELYEYDDIISMSLYYLCIAYSGEDHELTVFIANKLLRSPLHATISPYYCIQTLRRLAFAYYSLGLVGEAISSYEDIYDFSSSSDDPLIRIHRLYANYEIHAIMSSTNKTLRSYLTEDLLTIVYENDNRHSAYKRLITAIYNSDEEEEGLMKESLTEVLTDWGVPSHLHEVAANKLEAEAKRIVKSETRPKWSERGKYAELKDLSAPAFLKRVYADEIADDGAIAKETVRTSDRALMASVEGYISKREARGRDLGDAEGLRLITGPHIRPKRATLE